MKKSVYYCVGTSDKEYSVELVAAGDDRFDVVAFWGRRGAATQNQKKNKVPLSQAAASSLMDGLLSDKIAKGYMPGAQSVARQVAAEANTLEIIPPMLLVAVNHQDMQALLVDSAWLAQPKWDGVRVHVHKNGQMVYGISRTGQPVALPMPVVKALQESPLHSFLLDGELVDENLMLFDLLRYDGRNLMQEDADYRIRELHELGLESHFDVQLSPTAYSNKEKQGMASTLLANGGEGIVLKRKDAIYRSGRSGKLWPWIKHKFWATASVIVGNNKSGDKATRSVGMYLFDGTYLGNVSIARNQAVPPAGVVIEVRFLYRSSENGGLVQATLLRIRTDVEPWVCVASDLQIKGQVRE